MIRRGMSAHTYLQVARTVRRVMQACENKHIALVPVMVLTRLGTRPAGACGADVVEGVDDGVDPEPAAHAGGS